MIESRSFVLRIIRNQQWSIRLNSNERNSKNFGSIIENLHDDPSHDWYSSQMYPNLARFARESFSIVADLTGR